MMPGATEPMAPPPVDVSDPDKEPSFRASVVLRGRVVELVPLEERWIPALAHAGADPEVWRWLRIGPARTVEQMTTLVRGMLAEKTVGAVLPFVVRRLPEGTVVGMFRYFDIHRADRAVEIGTWLEPGVWRTPVNTEVKYLGLRHAFDVERVHRVQLRTDLRNERSQRAIERLGARREGVHREHYRLRSGTFRTSVIYSILAAEWPALRRDLEARLARPWPASESNPGDPVPRTP